MKHIYKMIFYMEIQKNSEKYWIFKYWIIKIQSNIYIIYINYTYI